MPMIGICLFDDDAGMTVKEARLIMVKISKRKDIIVC